MGGKGSVQKEYTKCMLNRIVTTVKLDGRELSPFSLLVCSEAEPAEESNTTGSSELVDVFTWLATPRLA